MDVTPVTGILLHIIGAMWVCGCVGVWAHKSHPQVADVVRLVGVSVDVVHQPLDCGGPLQLNDDGLRHALHDGVIAAQALVAQHTQQVFMKEPEVGEVQLQAGHADEDFPHRPDGGKFGDVQVVHRRPVLRCGY